MGLDAVELILEAEQGFGISLPDNEMSKIVTVGDFHDAIMRHLPGSEKRHCLSAVAFYRLRQPLFTITEASHGDVRPSTRLASLIPRGKRKSTWRRISQLTGLRLPSLCLPGWGVLAALAVAVFVVVGGALIFEWPFSYLLIVAFISSFILTCWVVDVLFDNGLPSQIETVGQLAKAVLAKNFAKLSEEINGYDHDEVWESVRILVANQLGVEIEKVRKEARFVADLGLS